MGIDIFLKELKSKDLSFVASKWLIERVPFIFKDDFKNYILWKEKLSKKILVDSRAISIIGSACVGFSLNPLKHYKLYDSDSDIDIAIISHHYFDLAWHHLRNLGASIYSLDRIQRISIDEHRSKYIYWGTICTDKILQIMPFGKEWTIALNEMSQIQPSVGKDIKVRIYNDFESLRSYHVNNLRNLRDQTVEGVTDE